MNFAIGWACGLNDLFVRFPYEKCKTIYTKWKTAVERRRIVKQIFTAAFHLILDDIIENNVTFKLQGIGYLYGEIHMDRVSGEDFIKQRKRGKFKKIDYFESIFTAFLMKLYIKGKRDNFLYGKSYPIYFSKDLRDKLIKYTNQGKQYS